MSYHTKRMATAKTVAGRALAVAASATMATAGVPLTPFAELAPRVALAEEVAQEPSGLSSAQTAVAQAESAAAMLTASNGVVKPTWDQLIEAVYYYESADDEVKALQENNTDKSDLQSKLNAIKTQFGAITAMDLSGDTGSCKYTKSTGPFTLFTGLTSLNLSNADITDVGGLANLSGLTSLNLSGNKGLQDLGGLTGLTSLTSLDASDTGVTSYGFLAKLTNLTSLNLANTNPKGEGKFGGVALCTKLTNLNLSGTGFDNNSFGAIVPLAQLKTLNLSNNPALSAIGPITTNGGSPACASSIEELDVSNTGLTQLQEEWDGTKSTVSLPQLKTLRAKGLHLADAQAISGLTTIAVQSNFSAQGLTWDLGGSYMPSDTDNHITQIQSKFSGGAFTPPTVAATEALAEANVTVTPTSATYTGTAIEPTVSVNSSTSSLTKGTDYILKFADNINAGTATVTVTGISQFIGSVTKQFTIGKADVSSATIGLSEDAFVYDGKAKEPKVTVRMGNRTLTEYNETSQLGDYSVSYANNTAVGTATVTIAGKGNNLTGSTTKNFTISEQDIAQATVTLPKDVAYTYDGTAKTPEPTVTVTLADGTEQTLTKGTDYTLSYASNVDAGTATVVVNGAGGYAGKNSATFTIEKASLNSVTFKFNASYPVDANGVTPVPSATLGEVELVSGVDYDITYTSNTNAGTGHATITGKGNFNGTRSLEFTIASKDLSGATVTLAGGSYVYTGAEVKPAVESVVVSNEPVDPSLYSVTYENNVNAGTATVTVTGTGSTYGGTASASFEIAPKALADANVASIPSQTYTGSALKPDVVVTDGNATLEEGTDYQLAYSDNIAVGTATVTVTGKGNYTGEVTKEFAIARAYVPAPTVPSVPTPTPDPEPTPDPDPTPEPGPDTTTDPETGDTTTTDPETGDTTTTNTETTENPDGSTTTTETETVTDPDGNVKGATETVTTEKTDADGTKTTEETVTAKDADGSVTGVTETVTVESEDEAGVRTVEQTVTEKDADGNVTSVTETTTTVTPADDGGSVTEAVSVTETTDPETGKELTVTEESTTVTDADGNEVTTSTVTTELGDMDELGDKVVVEETDAAGEVTVTEDEVTDVSVAEGAAHEPRAVTVEVTTTVTLPDGTSTSTVSSTTTVTRPDGAPGEGWEFISGDWYYVDAGLAEKGQADIGKHTYVFDEKTGAMKTGWDQDKDGNWRYLCDDHGGAFGAMFKDSWLSDGRGWYMVDASGSMLTGWQCPQDDGVWYYLNPRSDGHKGEMLTGWRFDGQAWYYLDESDGHMLRDAAVPGGRVGPNGRWIA